MSRGNLRTLFWTILMAALHEGPVMSTPLRRPLSLNPINNPPEEEEDFEYAYDFDYAYDQVPEEEEEEEVGFMPALQEEEEEDREVEGAEQHAPQEEDKEENEEDSEEEDSEEEDLEEETELSGNGDVITTEEDVEGADNETAMGETCPSAW
eukprot:GGOE01061372.1.p2 GENE.GGOE01061372.1~~GGOE01061372.1.p2  ORF type:complete len:165 (+),score=53.04 GGOE01061372.1:40-495(+)